MTKKIYPTEASQPLSIPMGVVEVPLTQGLFALIDVGDLPLIGGYRWHAVRAKKTYYAATRVGSTTIYLHRLVLGIHGLGRSMFADHVNCDGLDNRRQNLRRCSPAQNSHRRRTVKSKSGLRGVWQKGASWIAQIGHQGQFLYLGSFPTKDAAAAAYDDAARRLFGDFSPEPNCR